VLKGAHHVHLRKRLSRGLEPFPSRNRWKRFLDNVVIAVGILAPLMAVPQLLKIYALQDATSVSSLFWGFCALFNVPWILYGFTHHERPIVITYSLWFAVNTAVCASALYFGAGFL